MFHWIASHPRVEFVAVCLSLALAAALGAWASKSIRLGQVSPVWTYVAGLLSISIWAYQSKYSKMGLISSSILFDVVYGVTWTIVYLILGEPLTWLQGLGMLLITAGLILFGI